MNYKYEAFKEDEPEAFHRMETTGGKKIKNMVTVNITIEIDEAQYNAKRSKYKEPIPEKILKIFK